MTASRKASTENGFFLVANDMQDAICCHKFSLREKAIMDCLVRCTYGWGRKWTKPEVTQEFLALMSGIRRQHVSSGLRSLMADRVVLKEAGSYAINTELSEWGKSKTGFTYAEVLAQKSEPKRFKKDAKSEPNRFKSGPDLEEARTKTVHNVNQNGSKSEPNRFKSGPANADEQGVSGAPKYMKYMKDNTPPHGPQQEKADLQNDGSSGGGGGVLNTNTEPQGPLGWLPSEKRAALLSIAHQMLQRISPTGMSTSVARQFNTFLAFRAPPGCPRGERWARQLLGHLKAGISYAQQARAEPDNNVRSVPLLAFAHAKELLGETIRKFQESENPQ